MLIPCIALRREELALPQIPHTQIARVCLRPLQSDLVDKGREDKERSPRALGEPFREAVTE